MFSAGDCGRELSKDLQPENALNITYNIIQTRKKDSSFKSRFDVDAEKKGGLDGGREKKLLTSELFRAGDGGRQLSIILAAGECTQYSI